jgi:response regulator RpfG family c-di-GMP phosphodiesterase
MEDRAKKILIADDNRQDAEILQQLFLDAGYSAIIVSNGIDAIEAAIKECPDLVLLDVDMPGENGYSVARQLKSHRTTRFVPIIMLTALSELTSKLEGLEAGVDDYITKPYRPIELITRVRSLLRVKALNDQLDDAENIIFTLARIIEAKDSYTLGHADRVSRFAVALGRTLKRSPEELDTLDKGGLLHDIGKMAIPDSILLKPGALTKEEFDVMKTHPVIGCTIYEDGTAVSLDDGPITEAEADEMLRRLLGRYEAAVQRYAQVDLEQGQFDALVSFAYNVGNEALRGSTLLRLLNGGDVAGAANQFLRWDKAGGRTLPGLTRRRQAERRLFLGLGHSA